MSWKIETISPSDQKSLQESFAVFSVLRPALIQDEFLARTQTQFTEGYKMVCIRADGKIVAAAGYRFANFLAWGKVLYIDDLITHPDYKKQGLGGALLDWLEEQAAQEKCEQIHLDTGYQRLDAHRLYLNKGFSLVSHHMAKIVSANT